MSININNVIEKSKSLVLMKCADFDGRTLNFLDVYLSRINARDESSYFVEFTKSEYEKLMGGKDYKPEVLNRSLEKLLGNVIEIPLPDSKSGKKQYSKVTLFTRADCLFDENINQQVIRIACNTELKNVFFDLADDGYVKGILKNTIKFSSRYSNKLYWYLKDNSYKGKIKIDLDNLKTILDITAPRYNQYKYINSDILKKVQEEINDLSDLSFDYDKYCDTGIKVAGVEFTITVKKNSKAADNVIEGEYNEKIETPLEELLAYVEAIKEADKKEVVELIELYFGANRIEDEKLKDIYIKQKLLDVKNAKEIKRSKKSYLKGIVKNDIKNISSNVKRDKLPDWFGKKESELKQEETREEKENRLKEVYVLCEELGKQKDMQEIAKEYLELTERNIEDDLEETK